MQRITGKSSWQELPASFAQQGVRNAIALAISASLSLPSLAQGPVTDMDNWIRFPPRPRSPAPAPSDAATTNSVAPVPPKSPPASANTSVTANPSPSQAPNPRDSWVQFPIRSATPAVMNVPPLQTQPLPSEAPSEKVASEPFIKKFNFKGNQRVSDQQLARVVEKYVGIKVNTDVLVQATEAVNNFYRKMGYLAFAEMPNQDLTDGDVMIQIAEVRFSGAVVEDPTGQLSQTNLVKNIVEQQQPKNSLVDLKALDKATSVLAELPGVKTSVSLRPGEKSGETEAVANISEGKKIDANVSLDSAGAKSIGELRALGKLTLNNPLGLGDSADVQAVHSKGMDYQRVSYNLPVGYSGWRAGINASSSQYNLIATEYIALNAKGPSSSQGMDLSIPILREKDTQLSLQFAYDQKRFRNEAAGEIQSQYTGSALTSTLSGSASQNQNSTTSGNVQLVRGTIDLSGSTASHISSDASTVQTAGNYAKLKFNISQKYDFDANNSGLINLQSQFANKNLDSSEKFYLGGMQGVRAYPTNEAGGSLGNLVTMEWQRQFMLQDNRWTASGFIDYGDVTVNRNNDYLGASTLNKYSLSGYGLWLGTSVPSKQGISTFRLIWSHRLGNNPNANSTTGADQDGTLIYNRFRFSLNHAF
jgi:hemolysin activation/secretion protein